MTTNPLNTHDDATADALQACNGASALGHKETADFDLQIACGYAS
jgi:hypothetical protein